MTIDVRDDVAVDVPLLPEQPRRMGPVTRRLIARTAAIVGALEVGAVALILGVGGDTATALGTSMALPGGGLLFVGAPILFLLTMGLVALSIVFWWGISALWGLPAVWTVSGLVALALAGGTAWQWAVPVVFALAAVAIGAIVWSFEKRFRTKRAKVAELNEHLRTVEIDDVVRTWSPPNDMDYELQRWCYELALQPIDEFEGFEWGEQFHGGTCVRYQLNYLAWALSEYAVNTIPNAPTEIELVLRNMMLKQTDLRVWGYWKTLNTIGNLNTNPDPLVKDNIMFSGFTGDQLNMYEAATGSDFFDQPGSLTFVWKDGRTFSYDHHSWMAEVKKNFEKGRTSFFACEPGWAFAACNTIGAQAVLGYEVLHGGSMWRDLEPAWRKTLDDEYLLPDGNYANIRCTRTGLSWDTGETANGEYLVTGTNGFADVAPDLARRGRALATRGGLKEKMAMLRMAIVDGRLNIPVEEEFERNRFRKTALNGWTKIAGGARMVGEEEVALAAQASADAQCATGERWPERPLAVGVQNMAIHLIGRWGAPMNTGMLNLRGYVPPVGPVLGPVPWPQAMVTVARSIDGVTLDLSIRPVEGSADDVVTLSFSQLRPGATYSLGDTSLVADVDGCGSVDAPLRDLLDVKLAPNVR
ncbi:MAG TPA: hypothetical protein VEA78_00465 [Acidimicrobiales bacterium]|nr:hypothetical protein [Acidimicrobiales bacterium]